MYTEADLESMFTYHPATGEQPGFYGAIRGACLQLALSINELCPNTDEKRMAIIRLNEVMFWANSAIARHVGVKHEV